MNQFKKTIALVALSAAGVCVATVANAQGSGGPEAAYQMHIDPSYRNGAGSVSRDEKASMTVARDNATRPDSERKMQMAKAQTQSEDQAQKDWYQGH
jgi:hypothetical protein